MTFQPIVHTHFSGSEIVVQLNASFERYIDVRHTANNRVYYAEYVLNGFVQKTAYILKSEAPEQIMKFWREVCSTT